MTSHFPTHIAAPGCRQGARATWPVPPALTLLSHSKISRITTSIFTSTFLLCSTAAHAAPDELVLELQSTDDLRHWNSIALDAFFIRDGKLRLNQPLTGSQWFRIKVADGQNVAKTKLADFRANAGPALDVDDYTDLRLDGVDLSNINRVNEAVFLADQAVIASPEQLQQLVFEAAAVPIDPDAETYALRVGLDEPRTRRLSDFLTEIREAGIEPVWMILGRSEFLARDGATHRAVIGGDGTIEGDVPNLNSGIRISGRNADRFSFPTPAAIRSDQLTSLGMWSVLKRMSVPSDNQKIFSFSSSGTSRGPEYGVGDTLGELFRSHATFSTNNSSTSSRRMPAAGFAPNVFSFGGMQIMPDANGLRLGIYKDVHEDNGLTINSPSIWNLTNTGRLGGKLNHTERFNGEISFAMITSAAINQSQRLVFLNSLRHHRIASLNPPSVSYLIGDSMTVGASGASAYESRSSQLFALQSSGWRGSFYRNIAVGGTGIDAQEGYYQTAANELEALNGYENRTVWFWGGYNTQVFGNLGNDEAARQLADRYIAMAADAASRGFQTIHWSAITGRTVLPDSTHFQRVQLFNDYYKQKLATLPGDHIYYDHREKFTNSEFDGPNRTESYFSDDIHLSALGQQTLVADFLSKHPAP